MNTRVRIELNPVFYTTLNKAIDDSFEQAVKSMQSDIIASGVVPKNIGELERSGNIKKDCETRYRIVFDTPYARRLYWHPEFNFRTDKNPNAKGMWMQSYIDGGNKHFLRDNFNTLLKRNMKGMIK